MKLKKLTLRAVIKQYCANCFVKECVAYECPLYGLERKKKISDMESGIKTFCTWCMGFEPVNMCCQSDFTCVIHRYRANVKGELHVDFQLSEIANRFLCGDCNPTSQNSHTRKEQLDGQKSA